MSEEVVPLKPLTKEEIRKLELALILGTITRPDVLERIRNAEDKLTWLDSLIVAAGALARERAGLTIDVIAEELGRSESTIRHHLAGKTEAGKLVKETYDMLVKNGGKLKIAIPTEISSEIEHYRKRVEELEKEVQNLKAKLSEARSKLEEVLKTLTT